MLQTSVMARECCGERRARHGERRRRQKISSQQVLMDQCPDHEHATVKMAQPSKFIFISTRHTNSVQFIRGINQRSIYKTSSEINPTVVKKHQMSSCLSLAFNSTRAPSPSHGSINDDRPQSDASTRENLVQAEEAWLRPFTRVFFVGDLLTRMNRNGNDTHNLYQQCR